MAPPAILLLLLFLYADESSAAVEMVSRDFFPMEGDVAWVVQVSDLHLSAFHPERAQDLSGKLGPALRAIRPDILLVTGDIADAKNRKRTSTRQDESEWIQYRNFVDALVEESGFESRRIFDIRGNHDKYGVPFVGSELDFFSIHSVSSRFNRLGTVQSISLVASEYVHGAKFFVSELGYVGFHLLIDRPEEVFLQTIMVLDRGLQDQSAMACYGYLSHSFTHNAMVLGSCNF